MRLICGNADTTYMQAAIRGDGAYRVTGRRGTVRIVHLQVIAGFMGSREPLRVLADINLDQCRVDERGRSGVPGTLALVTVAGLGLMRRRNI